LFSCLHQVFLSKREKGFVSFLSKLLNKFLNQKKRKQFFNPNSVSIIINIGRKIHLTGRLGILLSDWNLFRWCLALGVSGGPDSMALCVLTASLKTNGLNRAGESSGFIDGILAIIVDHGLRAESKDEANIVSNRVSQMGTLCTDILWLPPPPSFWFNSVYWV
jgi:hypothetical protein